MSANEAERWPWRQACRRMHEEVLYMYVQGLPAAGVPWRGGGVRVGQVMGASRAGDCTYLHIIVRTCTMSEVSASVRVSPAL